MYKLLGLTFIAVAIAIYCAAFSVGVAWFAFCFGTIFIGVLLLLFAPLLLLAPPAFLFQFGNPLMVKGCYFLFTNKAVILEDVYQKRQVIVDSFDTNRIESITERFYYTHDNREHYPSEWEDAQKYMDSYHRAIFDRDNAAIACNRYCH